MIRLKEEKDITALRISGKILAHTLQLLKEKACEGVQLFVLDELAYQTITGAGGTPAFLGYTPEGGKKPYSASICASVNEVVVHGIPRDYRLKDGDVLKLDAGVSYQGYFTDAAITVIVGKVPARTKRLVEVTEEALGAAIAVCKPGNHLGDIGYAIERLVKKEGFKIIQGLTGHGVGFALHEDHSQATPHSKDMKNRSRKQKNPLILRK